MLSVELFPPPPAESGMENRVTSVLVAAFVVNSTNAPLLLSVTARRPDASPATSPTVLFGPTTAAPPPTTPSSASYMSYGMFAPRPTNSGRSEVLFACLTGSSLASTAITTRTVYRPLTAVQVPRVTGAVVTPTPIVPVNEPVSVRTAEPESLSTVSVMPCVPLAEATVPWLRMATVNVTVAPPGGLNGSQPTDPATRSELATGATTSEVAPVNELFASFSSITVLFTSTLAVTGYVPALRAPIPAETVVDAPAASPPTATVPTLVVPR